MISNTKGKASQVKPREAQEGIDAEAIDRTNQSESLTLEKSASFR